MQPKRRGNCGWYFRVLNWLSENGLSLEVCGRLCERVTPRHAHGLDPRVGQQQSGGLGLHWATATGMQRELAGRHVVFGDRVVEQRLEECRAFSVCHAPAHDTTAEDVEDDVEIEVAPFSWPDQLGDVPGPNLIGTFGQQLGLSVGGMAKLRATFVNLAVLLEDAVHGADRAAVDAFIKQGGVDLGRCLVSKPWFVQQIQHHLLLRNAQRAVWLRPRAGADRGSGQPGAPALHAGT